MSMIGNFRRVSTHKIEALRADPTPIASVLYPEDEATQVGSDVLLDVDKAWHGIHFLLNGEAWEGTPPLDFIVGGQAIGDIDVGYGPARGFTAEEVAAIAAALQPITVETLRSRFHPAAMTAAEIYPTIWDRNPEEDDTFGYLASYYEALKAFIASTAAAGAGLIVYIN